MRIIRNRKGTIIFCGIIFCILFYIIITTISICVYGSRDEKCNADVAIILGAGVTEKGVSPVYRERLNHGIQLYQEGYVGAIIVTGGLGQGNSESDAATAKKYIIEQGIPESIIYIEDQSTITQENIRYSKEIMEEMSFRTAILVSDPLHMKRAMAMASDYGIEAYSSPTPTSMYKSLKTKIPFLCREEFFYVGYGIYRLFD